MTALVSPSLLRGGGWRFVTPQSSSSPVSTPNVYVTREAVDRAREQLAVAKAASWNTSHAPPSFVPSTNANTPLSPHEARRRRVWTMAAIAFVVACLVVEFGTFTGLVAEINHHFYGVQDPTFPNGTWPIISFGLASSAGIQAFYIVVTSLALVANVAWFTWFDTVARHTGEHTAVCCGRARALWTARAMCQLLQMAFLIALGSISVLEARVAHNLMGLFAAIFFLLYEAMSIPYRADRLITLSKTRMARQRARCVPELLIISEVFFVGFFLVSFTCFWTVDCSGVAESSWWEYAMYLVFPVTRGFRVVDVMVWRWSPPPSPSSSSSYHTATRG